MKTITAMDLFCGAGGTSTGLIQAAESLGKKVDLTAINHCDKAIQTHKANHAQVQHLCENLDNVNPWVPARKIIDWSIEGQSIFNRKKPLAEKTLARIEYGLRKFGGEDFLVKFFGTGKGVSLDRPLDTVTANGQHYGLAQPFISILKGQSMSRPVDRPLPTLTTQNNMYLCQPFLISQNYTHAGPSRVRGINEPMPTLTTRPGQALVEPFILPQHQGRPGQLRVKPIDKPLSTLTTTGAEQLVEPSFLVGIDHASAGARHVRSLEKPAPTAVTQQNYALIHAHLIKYFGTGKAQSIDRPLDTVTTKDRFGLVEIFEKTPGLDIRLRMLQPHELAAAQSFPDDYKFCGNKGEIVKQIGNAVPGKIAAALCRELIA